MHSVGTAKRIAVIGGGLAGLSAAFRLTELARERGESLEITILEASSRLGGVIGTEQIGDYRVDIGADNFLTNKPGAVSLCRRLGIEHRLIPTDARYRGALVLFDGRPVPIPEGYQLLSPTALWPVLTSPLFSAWGKCRLFMEWFVPRRNLSKEAQNGQSASPAASNLGLVDESLADFARRRFGKEAFERLIQPLVGGIYTADPEKLSLAATMPRFLEMERDYGSLIRANLFAKPEPTVTGPKSKNSSQRPDASSGARYGLFAGLEGGMGDLVNALRTHVESTCIVRLNTPVTSINQQQNPDASSSESRKPKTENHDRRERYTLTLPKGASEQFDSVVVATTAARTASVLESLDETLSRELRGIEYSSSALVVTGHRLADIKHPLNAFGLVIPHIERRRILAVSFSSRKFANRAPAGRVLLRTFVGGALQPELFYLNDEQMIEAVTEELADIFGVRGTPDFVRIYRYERAMPQYHVGHLDRIANIERLTRQYPGLTLAGIGYRGVGMPDVIASGERAAEELVATVNAC